MFPALNIKIDRDARGEKWIRKKRGRGDIYSGLVAEFTRSVVILTQNEKRDIRAVILTRGETLNANM